MGILEFFHQDVFLKFLAALLALINPLYGIPIFLSMTKGYTEAERNRTAMIVAFTVMVTALVATLIGEEVLSVFGIHVPSFRVAGGIIILGIAFAMMKADEPSAGDAKAAMEGQKKDSNIAVVPLAIPLTIGPGAIVTAIVFGHQLDDGDEIATLVPAILGVCLLIWVGLRFAGTIARVLGETGMNIITRIMAIILAAVAIEMIMTGVVQIVDENYPNLRGAGQHNPS